MSSLLRIKKIITNSIKRLKGGRYQTALCALLALVLCTLSVCGAVPSIYGADSDDLEDEIEDAQDEAEDIQDEIDSLNDQLSQISDTIEDINSQITETEDEISALEDEIANAQENIARLEENKEDQYASVVAWIQVSYENNFDSLFMSVMSAESFSEVLTQAEYVQSISEFGFDLIERYNEIVSELETEKASLESQSASLEEKMASLSELETQATEKKAEITELISQAQEELADKNDEIDSLEAELEAQLEYEAELEAQREAEEAQHAAELAALEEANTADAVISTDTGDLELLAALIYCEAGGESYEGKLAVACVVMNRVRSSSYPSTIYGVIYQSGQFTPASSERLATVLANALATESCYDAAAYVLAGNLPYPNFLSFCSASVSLGIKTTVIGNHQFY